MCITYRGGENMETNSLAYVLMSVTPGQEENILHDLLKKPYILEADIIGGADYDIIAKFSGDNLNEIAAYIVNMRKSIDGILKTETLPVLDKI